MTERELFNHICQMASQKPKGLQPPFAETAIPLHPDDPVDYERVRDAACSAVLGPSDFVYHPSLGAPHIDVYRYPPNSERPFWSYITNGMSDFPIQLPNGEYFRAEILAATSGDNPLAAQLLRVLGQVPFSAPTFLHYYHTVPFPQGVLAPQFKSVLLIPPFLASNLATFELLPGESVLLLQVIAITESERKFAMAKGSEKLVEELPDDLSTWLLDGRAMGR
jgi:hypothetical protein